MNGEEDDCLKSRHDRELSSGSHGRRDPGPRREDGNGCRSHARRCVEAREEHGPVYERTVALVVTKKQR